jgi:hypothetical protein
MGSKEYVWLSQETGELFLLHQAPAPGEENDPHSMHLSYDGVDEKAFEDTFFYLGEL